MYIIFNYIYMFYFIIKNKYIYMSVYQLKLYLQYYKIIIRHKNIRKNALKYLKNVI